MLNQNLTTLLTAIFAVVGAVVGGFIAAYASQIMNRNTEKKKKYLGKIEELYEASIQVKLWIEEEYEGWWLKYEHAVDKKENHREHPTERVIMLSELYAPSVTKYAKMMSYVVDHFVEMPYIIFDNHYHVVGDGEFYNDIRGNFDQFKDAYEKLTSTVAALIAKNVRV